MSNKEYKMTSTSSSTSSIEDIELGDSDTKLTRKVIRAQIINNDVVELNSVKLAIVHQRRNKVDIPWQDLGGPTLAELKAGDAAKMQLNTSETQELLEHLQNLYAIGREGVLPGTKVLKVANEDAVIEADSGRARIIRMLLQANHGEEIWNALVEEEPDLASKLALSQLYGQRKLVVDEFERNIGEIKDEAYWQKLLERNRWIFGTCYIGFVNERRINIASTVDHPLVTEDGYLEIVEIKRPDFPFWAHMKDGRLFEYRGKYLVPYHELEGAISQAGNYILELEKEADRKSYADSHNGLYPLKPRCLIVHGRSTEWGEQEARDFRLLNDRLHGITVITFDHLLSRAKQSLDVIRT